jgi:DnaJ-class molecular chaperone
MAKKKDPRCPMCGGTGEAHPRHVEETFDHVHHDGTVMTTAVIARCWKCDGEGYLKGYHGDGG